MGLVFKTILAFCIGWGALYAAQHYWLNATTAQIAENSGLNLLPPTPALPSMEIDPEKLRLAINPPVVIDTRAAQRAAAEGMVRQIEQQQQAIQPYTAKPLHIPGLH